MITEEMLCAAAARSCEIYVDYLERGYDPENQHEFSLQFEKKIKKLKRKADHPVFYYTTKRIASIVLAILINGGVWLAVDVEARAAFIGWIKEIYETYVVYVFEDETPATDEDIDYRPTWVPEGYKEFYYDDSEDTVFVAYSNETGQMMNFSYIHAPDETKWLVDRNNTIVKQVEINDCIAELFISTDSNNASAIMWSTSDNTAFYVSVFADEAELIQIAESVAPFKN